MIFTVEFQTDLVDEPSKRSTSWSAQIPLLKSIATRKSFPFSVHDPFSVVSGPSSPRLRRGKLINFFRLRSAFSLGFHLDVRTSAFR